MKKVFVAACALAVLGLALSACPSFDNVAACEEWLASMECGDQDFSGLVDCEIYSADSYPCDVADYFNCLTDNGSCDDALGIYDSSGWVDCTDLAACN